MLRGIVLTLIQNLAFIRTWQMVLMTVKYYPQGFQLYLPTTEDCVLLDIHLPVYIYDSFNAVCKNAVGHRARISTFKLSHYH